MAKPFKQGFRRDWKKNMEDTEYYISELISISKKTGLKLDQVIKIYEIIEQERFNSMYKENGDNIDENISGFAKLIEQFLAQVEELNNNLKELINN